MKPRSRSPAQPTATLSPTARIASSSALIPIWYWKGLRPSAGMTAPTAPAAISRGHQPTRSSWRWRSPRSPGAYSRRPPERATHSSTPIEGLSRDSTEGCSVLTSHLLELHAAEEAARAQQHHCDQDPEHDQVCERGADIARDHRLGNADQQAAQNRARDRSDPADDRGGERLQT